MFTKYFIMNSDEFVNLVGVETHSPFSPGVRSFVFYEHAHIAIERMAASRYDTSNYRIVALDCSIREVE